MCSMENKWGMTSLGSYRSVTDWDQGWLTHQSEVTNTYRIFRKVGTGSCRELCLGTGYEPAGARGSGLAMNMGHTVPCVCCWPDQEEVNEPVSVSWKKTRALVFVLCWTSYLLNNEELVRGAKVGTVTMRW